MSASSTVLGSRLCRWNRLCIVCVVHICLCNINKSISSTHHACSNYFVTIGYVGINHGRGSHIGITSYAYNGRLSGLTVPVSRYSYDTSYIAELTPRATTGLGISVETAPPTAPAKKPSSKEPPDSIAQYPPSIAAAAVVTPATTAAATPPVAAATAMQPTTTSAPIAHSHQASPVGSLWTIGLLLQ